MSDYTPTTQQVEDGFAHEPEYEYHNPIGYGAHVRANRRAFKRWLAEVERAAAEKALTELAESYVYVHSVSRTSSRVYQWLKSRADAYRRNEGENE